MNHAEHEQFFDHMWNAISPKARETVASVVGEAGKGLADESRITMTEILVAAFYKYEGFLQSSEHLEICPQCREREKGRSH